MTLRLSDGTDLVGRPKFIAKDCMLFEESPDKPLLTVALGHIVLVRIND